MLAHSRAARLLAGVVVLLLSVPFVLSTSWVEAFVFEQVTAWARNRHGLDIRAARFGYDLASLTLGADGVSVAAVGGTADHPLARIERLEIDLAAAALRGRLHFDAIRVSGARIIIDSTTRRPSPSGPSPAASVPARLPPFRLGTAQIDDLEFSLGDAGANQLVVRGVSAWLRGRGQPEDVEGTLTVTGGVTVTFGDALRMAFDRADARVTLDQQGRVSGSLTAASAVGDVRAEGSVPLALDEPLDLRYEATALLEELQQWWGDAPAWSGRVDLRGEVRGPVRSPAVSYSVSSTNLGWRSFAGGALDASGRVSSTSLIIEALTLASRSGALEGHGTLAFRPGETTDVTARWTRVQPGMVAGLFSRTLDRPAPATVDGSARLSWLGPRPRLSTIAGRIEAGARGTAPDTTAVAALDASGQRGRWQVGVRQHLDGEATATVRGTLALDEARVSRSVVGGTLQIQAQDVGATLAQLRRLGAPVPAAELVASERVRLDGTIAGTLASPRLAGALSADGVRAGALDDVRLNGQVTLDAIAFALSPLEVELPGTRATLRGTLPWLGSAGQGSFSARITDLTPLTRSVPRSWQPRAAVDASGSWTGSVRDLAITTELAADGFSINGNAFESATARASFSQGRVTVEELRATQPGGALTASGSWHLADSVVSVRATGTNLALAVDEPIEGTPIRRAELTGVSFEARVGGPVARPDGSITMAAGSAAVLGRALGPVSARAESVDGVARVGAAVPSYGATIDGRLTLDPAWPFDGRLTVNGADAAALARLAGASDAAVDAVRVSLDATIDAVGHAGALSATDATLSVTSIDGTIRGRPVSVAEPGRLHLTDQRLAVVEPLRLTWGATSVAVTQTTASSARPGISVALQGSLADITSLAPEMLPNDVAADGTVRAEILLGDRLGEFEPTGEITMTLASLTRGAQELARDTIVVADADATTLTVRELRGTVLGGPLAAHGTAPMAWFRPDAGRTQASVPPATFSLTSSPSAGAIMALLRDQPPATSGALDLTIDGSATAPRLESVQATLRDRTTEVTLGGFALRPRRTTELRLDGGLLHVDQFEWTGPRSTFVASGSLALSDTVEGRLDLDGDGSLALLTLLVPARIDGRATFDLELSGPPGGRELLGTVGIEDGTMVVQPWRLALAAWSGNVVLERDRVDVKGLRGQLNGGEATVEGHFPVGAGTAAPQSLTIAVRGAFLDLPRGLRSQLDASLEWSHAGGDARLSGDATVTARTYREPVTEIARIVGALMDRSRASSPSLPALVAATNLDVHLSTVGPLTMVNSVGRVELFPDLQLTGTLSSPALRGQVAVADDGRIQFGGRQYRLRDSRVEFSPDRGLIPRLALSGETRVADYTVFVRFSGTVDQIETSLSSDPPLGERDLQTLLVTGQRDSIGRNNASDQNAVGALSGDVLGFAGQFLGFDAVTVGTSDDLQLVSSNVNPALRLTVSRRIGRRFELVLSDNLDDNELTWVVIYRPRPGFEFRVISRDNTEFTGEFRQEIAFGPGVAPPRTTVRRQAPRERVAAITISGEPGLPAAEVLAVTSLRVGHAFDFTRWLEDRDRIASHYQRRGYFAVRIVPTRRLLDEGEGSGRRVALDYRVTRGPRTVLTVSGYTAPPAVEAALRQAWSDSVLMALLEADLAQVMRRHLVDVGFLRATVAVEVDDSVMGVVTASVRVDPGPRSTDRRLAFSGNTVLSDQALLETVAANGDITSPWLDPAPLLEVLQVAYAARGYLAMTAVPGAIEFAETAAILPIQIVEGPLARVSSISLNGAERVRPSDAAAAMGLAVGDTVVAGGEQAARLALERYYLNLGYRDVVVGLQSTVDAAAGRVDIAVTITEGARHVVRSVHTTGVQSTRAATVERAARIEPGSPASPAVADATRRRLQDVGTFRSTEVAFAPVEGASTDAIVPVDALVTVQEAKRFLLLYGLEVTNQYQSLFSQRVTSGGVAADLRDRNFLGRGWTLGAGVRYEPSFKSARALAAVPRLGSTRIRTNLYADSSSEERARTESVALFDDETNVSIEQRWRPRTPMELSWGYQFNRRDIRAVSTETDRTLLDIRGYLAALAGAAVLDHRDNLFDARRGWVISTTLEWGLQPLGSDFDYLRTVARASHYLPVGPLTVASNARWGDLVAFRGQPPISALDLFYTAGGTQTVRGYKQDSLSAYTLELDGERIALGGTKMLVFNEEVRFPLFWLFSGAGFIDAGNTFTDERGIVLRDLAVGAGFGVRIRTPLAPVRIDLGFPVAGRQGQSGARWHFSIGQIF